MSKHGHNWKGCGDLSAHLWGRIVREAASRRITVTISIEDAWALYVQQKGRCSYSGLPIGFGRDCTASLDRIDSQRGYVAGNIHWVHKVVNRMKWKLPENDFLRLVYLICQPASCGNVFVLRQDHHPKWTGCGNLPTWVVGRYRNVARRRGKEFADDVDAEYLWGLYCGQNQACALSGLPIDFPRHAYARKQATASLDRINGQFGYIRGNLQWLYKDVNQMKGSLSDEELREMCQRISEYSPLLAELSERRAA